MLAVTMPSRWSSAGSVDDSVQLCRELGVELRSHPIEPGRGLCGAVRAQLRPAAARPAARENLQARVRHRADGGLNTFGHLLLTTGNKSEISVGYCTLYGDTNGGLGLIGDLYKTRSSLCRHLNADAGASIPLAIIDKPHRPELAPDQKDTDSLPPLRGCSTTC